MNQEVESAEEIFAEMSKDEQSSLMLRFMKMRPKVRVVLLSAIVNSAFVMSPDSEVDDFIALLKETRPLAKDQWLSKLGEILRQSPGTVNK